MQLYTRQSDEQSKFKSDLACNFHKEALAKKVRARMNFRSCLHRRSRDTLSILLWTVIQKAKLCKGCEKHGKLAIAVCKQATSRKATPANNGRTQSQLHIGVAQTIIIWGCPHFASQCLSSQPFALGCDPGGLKFLPPCFHVLPRHSSLPGKACVKWSQKSRNTV